VPPGAVHLTVFFEMSEGGTDATPVELDVDVPTAGTSVSVAVP
jgi:hypothetical protein